MRDLSTTFRRVISTKRNGLKILYSEVEKISYNTNGLSADSSAEECHKILLEISRIRQKLESSIEVIKSCAKQWESAIEKLENEEEKSTEGRILAQYFTDSLTESNSITAIESDIIEQIFVLAAEESSLTRMMKHALSRNEYLGGASAIPTGNMNITHAERTAPVSITQIPLTQLPSLSLPKFNGKDNYKDYWTVFSDLIDKKDLEEATKQRYFESSLEGEALDLLRHLKKRGLEYSGIIKQFNAEYRKSEYRCPVHSAARSTKSHVPFEAKAQVSDDSMKPKARGWKDKFHERPIPVAAGNDQFRMITESAKLVNPEDGRTENADIFLDCRSVETLITEKTRSKLGLQTILSETLDCTEEQVGGRSDGIKVNEIVHVSLPTSNGSIEMDAVVHPESLTCALPQAKFTKADKKVLQKMKTTMDQPIHRVLRVTPHLRIGGKTFYEITGIASERLSSGLLSVPTAIGMKMFDDHRDLLRILRLTDPFKPPPIQIFEYYVMIEYWSFIRLLVRKRATSRQKHIVLLMILAMAVLIQEVRSYSEESLFDSESEMCSGKKCQTFVNRLATITSDSDSFSLPCSMEREPSKRTITAEQAEFYQMCTVSCENPEDIQGILKHAGVLTDKKEITESLRGDKNATIDLSSLSDLTHITSVLISFWKKTLLKIVTMRIQMFLSSLHAIPYIIQMSYCCRKRYRKKIPRKELWPELENESNIFLAYTTHTQ